MDVLRPVFERTSGRDGRVSIEVDARISGDANRTAAETRRLWWLVDRPNLFIKIPATEAALPAIADCLADGISVNVTLIFSLERYKAVLESFLSGLEKRKSSGGSLSGIESVASFFISRVDTETDRRLSEIEAKGSDDGAAARRLHGQAAIANARLAYQIYEDMLNTPRWQALAASGARPQRLLWASTGVKDKAFDDTRYVVDLVAPDTVNTMPTATLRAVADHGAIRGDTIRAGYDQAWDTLDGLSKLGIDMADVAESLEHQGVATFVKSWNELIGSVTEKLKDQGASVNPEGSVKPASGKEGSAAVPAASVHA
jgi:transaldolase